MKRLAPAAFVVLFLVSACGYRAVRGTVPGGGDAIHVPIAGNNTAYPGLAGPLSAAVRKRLGRSGVNVVGSKKGAPRLEITIIDARGEPGMLTTRDDRLTPVDTVWHITVEAKITRLGNDELAPLEQFEAQGRAYSGGTVLAEETLGHRRRQALLDNLADAIARFFFELNISTGRDK